MSADIYITTDDGSRLDVNYTYNLTRMHAAALEGVALHTDRPHPNLFMLRLETLVAKFKADPDRYRELNPTNGWGDYDSHLAQLLEITDFIREHGPVAAVEYSL